MVAQQITAGIYQRIHLFIGQGKTGRDLVDELSPLKLLNAFEVEQNEIGLDGLKTPRLLISI